MSLDHFMLVYRSHKYKEQATTITNNQPVITVVERQKMRNKILTREFVV